MENDIVTLTSEETLSAAKFSFFSLFWQADWIVKMVILILLACSVVCWAIIVHKYLQILRIKRLSFRFEDKFWSGTSIPGLVERIGDSPKTSLEMILLCCYEEWTQSKTEIEMGGEERVMARIANLARSTIDQEYQRLSNHLSPLASFGSACPFIGLFGTVWGIMNSFSAIAISKQTSLAIVAPGIAEALFATALGLVAAIPATLAYNKFLGDIESLSRNNEQFTTEVLAIFSRQIVHIRAKSKSS